MPSFGTTAARRWLGTLDLMFIRGRDLRAAGVTLATVLLLALTPGCSGHQNFIDIMRHDVGKGIDNPYLTRNQYPERRVGQKMLPNGNIEEEYRAGWRACRVFFEIDKKAGKVVGWRYEGSDKDCSIPP